MISNTVIVLLTAFIVKVFSPEANGPVIFIWYATLIAAALFDWFNICMTLNKDKRESD